MIAQVKERNQRSCEGHYGFKQAAEGTLTFAPLDFSTAPRAVLDVGTADGLWMRDVQSTLPSPPHGMHTFTGTDVNESFFPASSPSTIKYIKQDIKSPSPQSWEASFDLVNLRMILIAAGSGSAQRAVLNEHIKLVKPGGWIQIGDCDRICPTPVAENPHYHDMFACIRAVCQASGADPLEALKRKGVAGRSRIAGRAGVHGDASGGEEECGLKAG